MCELCLHNTYNSWKLPTFQWETSDFPLEAEKSYSQRAMNLKEIVIERLNQLGLGAVEAATAAGIERTFIRDIVEDKKKSVRADKLPVLAAALKLDPSALAAGTLVPIDETTLPDPEDVEFMELWKKANSADRDVILALLRSRISSKGQ